MEIVFQKPSNKIQIFLFKHTKPEVRRVATMSHMSCTAQTLPLFPSMGQGLGPSLVSLQVPDPNFLEMR